MISIIIPSKDSSQFIGYTLESILEQDFKDYEVIVVDSSADNTLDIVKEYSDKIKIKVIFQPPSGQVNAINLGMKSANGDIFTFINADDIYEPGALSAVNKAFTDNKECQWLYGKGKIIDVSGIYIKGIVTKFKEIWQPLCNYRVLTWMDYIVQPTAFWHKSLIDKIGYFDSQYKYSFDYDFWLRSHKTYKPVFINQYLACWRYHPQAISVVEYKEEIEQALGISRIYSTNIIDRFMQQSISYGVLFTYSIMHIFDKH